MNVLCQEVSGQPIFDHFLFQKISYLLIKSKTIKSEKYLFRVSFTMVGAEKHNTRTLFELNAHALIKHNGE